MIVGIPREIIPGEKRVALVPEGVGKLIEADLEVLVQSGAGQAAGYSDQRYQEAGAGIEADAAGLYARADIILKVREPAADCGDGQGEVEQFRDETALISFLFPGNHPETVKRLEEKNIRSFAMELMPRITRAQSMDALSSMSSIAGYQAVLIAAEILPKFFPMLMTAAGTITPAKVLVLGAGVAGLQAIATAKRLGAVVEAYDIRPVVKEQVESLGAKFIELEVATEDAEDSGGYAKEQGEETQEQIRQLLLERIAQSDAVITTALVPGKKAPLLMTREMVEAMSPGALVVDLAAEQGGNCELTEAGETVEHKGVKIIGPVDLPSTMAVHASDMYSRNISTYLLHLVNDGKLNLDPEDELVTGPRVSGELDAAAAKEEENPAEGPEPEAETGEGEPSDG
ncbi:MAG: Re/Si-specific NAD(P)(+) transhydrogenase subunit alpha [Planctomycetota bacterium]|nr:Re/Si-specific NAD(P)(+) transhydrogenase subunit alpha [Planctomycetota bacterium]